MTLNEAPVQPLHAIETYYAGCRFRSRTEARWGVFFNALDIPWHYEPQGYTVGPLGTPYLPDFWLPSMEVWVEVKGVMSAHELRTLIYAASGAGLPLAPDVPLTHSALYPERRRILVLGSIPDPGVGWVHQCLSAVADDLVVRQPFTFVPTLQDHTDKPLWKPVPIGDWHPLNQFVAGAEPEVGMLRRLVDGFDTPFLLPYRLLSDAYRAARSARFEHGESG